MRLLSGACVFPYLRSDLCEYKQKGALTLKAEEPIVPLINRFALT